MGTVRSACSPSSPVLGGPLRRGGAHVPRIPALRHPCFWALAVLFGVLATPALAQPDPSGIEFVRVGSPGNRATLPSETPLDPDRPRGAVSYEFRIAKEPLAASEYLVFANAYGPHVRDLGTALQVASNWLDMFPQPDGSWRFGLREEWSNVAAMTDFEMAARFVNWLHNDHRPERWAFEGGVYDTSTFGHTIPPPHQMTPAPGARYWLPTVDELTKAVYYDPAKGGPGVEGYWAYPNASDVPLVAGLPGTGAETIGDTLIGTNRRIGDWALGQYPATQTPWGLLDVSGTVPTLTATLMSPHDDEVFVVGSFAQETLYQYHDHIAQGGGDALWFGLGGAIRVAAAVPSPSVLSALMLLLVVGPRRRSTP